MGLLYNSVTEMHATSKTADPSSSYLLAVQSLLVVVCFQNGRKEFAWIMRHQDPLQCGIGSVLRWLLWRYEFCEDKKYPDFSSRKSW